MKKILAILVGFLVLAAPVMAAIETAEILPIAEPGITPDSPLYGLDRTVEKIRLRITTNEVKRAELRYEIAEERLAEAKVMAEEEKPELADQMIVEYEAELEETNVEMEKAVASGKDVSTLSERVAERSARHLEVMERVYEKAPEAAKEAILHAIEMSSKHYMRAVECVEDGEELKERIRERVREKGLDKGKIKEAVSEIIEIEAIDLEIDTEETDITAQVIRRGKASDKNDEIEPAPVDPIDEIGMPDLESGR